MNQKNKLILIVFVILVWGFLAFIFLKKDSSEPTPIEVEQPTSTTSPIVVTENPTTTNSNLKTYRNEGWGFEFEYPKDLILKEKVFSNYYSKFNLVLFKPIGESRDDAILVNIVLPEFTETDFWKSQKNSSKTSVDSVEGIKYEYKQDGSPHTTVMFPFGEFVTIVATGEGSHIYEEELNQILSSFRFLNSE